MFIRTPKSDRDYRLFTELFTMLHDGKDYCRNGRTLFEIKRLTNLFDLMDETCASLY